MCAHLSKKAEEDGSSRCAAVEFAEMRDFQLCVTAVTDGGDDDGAATVVRDVTM